MTSAETHEHDDLATRADLDALALRLDLRFDQVDQRFEHVDARFEQVDRRFDDMHINLQTLGNGIGSVSAYLNRVVLAVFTLLGASLVTLLVRVVD